MEILKTGIIYDPRMLGHKARRKHPQTPLRISVIINFLEEKAVLKHEKIDYVSSVHRLALQSELGMVHPQKYINFCKNLWPKSGHRADITVLDTYFNQKSQEAARIATGCLLQGIDKLMEGVWKNGFAIIRPPGHHSGAKSTINGFCIYNNVAIGAIYILQKWKKQKVVIVDWDVHHGDGTQHIMQKNEDVLVISLHRHDRGIFYPAGEEGHFSNNGELSAKGTKINIPFDFVDQEYNPYDFQAPGDNEYIYAYHRVIEPVIKQFNPDFILISSGFDAANGDPLGGFTVTPNGYYYLTKKLLQFKKPTLVALQGGYNLNSVKTSAYAIVKALLREQPPEQHVDSKGNVLKQDEMKDLCSLHPFIHEQMDSMIGFHSEYWKCLKEEQLIKYTEKVKLNAQKCFGVISAQFSSSEESKSSQELETKDIEEFHTDSKVQLIANLSEQKKDGSLQGKKAKPNKVKAKKNKKYEQSLKQQDQSQITAQFYFAAGHMQRFKNFSLSNPKLHKWAYQPQIQFFQSNVEQRKFAPQFFGKQDNYIVIENLLYNKKPPLIIMDIKLSRQSKNPFIPQDKRLKEKKKEESGTADKLAFRISGYTTQKFKQGGIMTYKEEEVKKLLKLVVDKNNQDLFCDFIQKMVDCLSQVKRKYWGTSIVLVKSSNNSVIRWIDFHYYKRDAEECDSDLLEGLQNLRNFIQSIIQ